MILHKYADADSGFIVGVPAGWRLDSTGVMGSRLVMFAPSAPGDFQANVNITLQDLASVTADEFVTVTRIQLKQFAGSPSLDVDEPRGEAGAGHVFAWTTHRGAVPVRGHQVLNFRAGRCYALTLSARPEQFEQLRPEFEAILGSFQLTDPVPPAGRMPSPEQPPAPPATTS
jgi:hypothetical protein